MTQRSFKAFSLSVIIFLTAFGFGVSAAYAEICRWAWRDLDMTAFGFVAPDQTPVTDSSFVRRASDRNMLEVALGEMAQERGSNPAVKQFGQKMAAEYTLAGNRLLEIAERDRLQVPTDMDMRDYRVRLRLSELNGRDFDRAYIDYVIRDQKKDLTLFEKMANEGTNPDLRGYACDFLLDLHVHLRTARRIYGGIT